MVLEAILTGRQTRLEIQCLYRNPMSNNFHKTSLLKKYNSELETLGTRKRILRTKSERCGCAKKRPVVI